MKLMDDADVLLLEAALRIIFVADSHAKGGQRQLQNIADCLVCSGNRNSCPSCLRWAEDRGRKRLLGKPSDICGATFEVPSKLPCMVSIGPAEAPVELASRV